MTCPYPLGLIDVTLDSHFQLCLHDFPLGLSPKPQVGLLLVHMVDQKSQGINYQTPPSLWHSPCPVTGWSWYINPAALLLFGYMILRLVFCSVFPWDEVSVIHGDRSFICHPFILFLISLHFHQYSCMSLLYYLHVNPCLWVCFNLGEPKTRLHLAKNPIVAFTSLY